MGFVHSKSSRVLVNDRHLSGSISGYTCTHERAASEVTCLMDEGAAYIPGLLSGSLSLNGFFDPSDGGIHATMQAAVNVNDGLLTTVLPDGFTVGQPAFIAASDLSSYTVESAPADAVSLTVEATPDAGVDWGVSQHAHTPETATGTAASVDNTDATTNGGVASLHVTAASGTTPSLTVTIQDSADDSTWVDLVAFEVATGATSQRTAVAGAVGQYTRASWTVLGTTPSLTFACAFARR